MTDDSRRGHRRRLRERFLRSGLGGLQDYEVVELLLSLGTPRKDCKQPAKDAVRKFSGLRGVLEAAPEELQTIEGIGPHNAFGIRLMQELARELLEARLRDRPYVSSSAEVYDYLSVAMRSLTNEVFKVLHLDAANRIIAVEDLAEGTVNASAVAVRSVVEAALRRRSVSLVLAHNHPSGAVNPSLADKALTRELVQAARLVDIRVLDHLIVGDDRFYSFAGEGLIEEYEAEATRQRMKGAAEMRRRHYKT
jgi:DNA repair protein RadC